MTICVFFTDSEKGRLNQSSFAQGSYGAWHVPAEKTGCATQPHVHLGRFELPFSETRGFVSGGTVCFVTSGPRRHWFLSESEHII